MNKEQFLAALEAALADKDQSKVEELGRQAVENYPEDAFGYAYLAEALLLMDVVKYHNVEILLAKSIQLDDDNLDYRLRFAYVKEMQDMFDDATILYNQILDKNPSNATSLKNLGAIELYITSNHQSALDFFNRALETDSSDEDLWAMKTEVHVALEQFEDALAAADNGLANGFNVSNASAKLIVLSYMGKNDGAEELYLKLFETDPDNFSYRFNYGKLLMDERRYADAEKQFHNALDIMDDGDPILRIKLANAKAKQGKFAEAIELYDTCIEQNADEAELYGSRAEAKSGKEDFKGALDDLDTAIKITGDDPLMAGTYSLIQGLVYYDQGDVNKAKSVMKDLASEGMTRTLGYYGIGVILHKEGDYDKSYTLLKLAKQMFSQDASDYIDENLSDYLAQKKSEILKNQAGEISRNAKSELLNKLSGKLWKFKDLNSNKVDALEADVQEQIKKSLGVLSILFTEKGVVLVSQGEGETLTYKITNEAANKASAKFMVLDGDSSYDVQLKLTNGQFAFSKEENEWIILEEQDLKTIPGELKQNFKKVISKSSTNFLGAKATAIINAIY